MTQPELAEKIGVSRSAISMYEGGKREPEYEVLEAIADTFNVDMNTLIGKENQTIKDNGPPGYDLLTPENRSIVDRLIADLVATQKSKNI